MVTSKRGVEMTIREREGWRGNDKRRGRVKNQWKRTITTRGKSAIK